MAAALLAALQESGHSWDLLDFAGLIDTASNRPHLDAIRQRSELEPVRAPYISLPVSWEIYERECLSANRRQQLRRRRRALERDYAGQVEYRQVTEAKEVCKSLDVLSELTKER